MQSLPTQLLFYHITHFFLYIIVVLLGFYTIYFRNYNNIILNKQPMLLLVLDKIPLSSDLSHLQRFQIK